jgi:hypothetical protein
LNTTSGDGNFAFSRGLWQSAGDGSGEYCVNHQRTATIALEFSTGLSSEFSRGCAVGWEKQKSQKKKYINCRREKKKYAGEKG